MLDYVKELLLENKIELCGCVPLSECTVAKPHLLKRADITDGSAIVFAVPYFVDDREGATVSVYAAPKDYHLYFKELYESILPKLKKRFQNNKLALFADHSPINEVEAAAKCGLGVIGKHGLLITEKYSSFVFIASLITDAVIDSPACEIRVCEDCGLCKKHCPTSLSKSECLSAITQKKGELSDLEIELIKKYRTAWGCDICQMVCPHTKNAILKGTISSPVPFFSSDRLPFPTYADINNMSDEEFSERAFSWRGRAVILRNLKLLDDRRSDEGEEKRIGP